MKRALIAAFTIVLGVGGSASGLLASRAGATSLPAAAAPAAQAVPDTEAEVAPAPAPAPSAEEVAVPSKPPAFADDPPAPEKTRAPKHAEWKGAPAVRLTRSNDPRCKAQRIREWIRLDCDVPGADSIALLAGSREGVEIWTSELEGHGAVVIFPVRRGDRRLFQLNESAGKYGVSPAALVSEAWVLGEDVPAITLQRI